MENWEKTESKGKLKKKKEKKNQSENVICLTQVYTDDKVFEYRKLRVHAH